jgi:hypothetical protein
MRPAQLALTTTKGGSTQVFHTAFRFGVGNSPEAWEIPSDILGSGCAWLRWTPKDIEVFSPHAKAISEIRTQRDLDVCRRIYDNSFRVGDTLPEWDVSFSLEFLMNTGAKHFPARQVWEARGYAPDRFGRWLGPNGDVALPLYEGRMIGQFDFSQKGWESGKGRTAVWRSLGFENKTLLPQFLMSEATYRSLGGDPSMTKFVFMRIAASTNERTMIGCATAGFPCGDSASTLRAPSNPLLKALFMSASMCSLPFDFVTRQRVSGLHLDWHIVSELPLPKRGILSDHKEIEARRLILPAARLALPHHRFAPEWLRLLHLFQTLKDREWKHWWAVAEADRLRLRVEIDALVADLYGLDPDDFDWIVRDDPKDPKGFYRVDRQLPFRERLTGLAAAAFRALKKGKWSANSAAKLTNDEFYEIISIPEMTTGKEPLIRKRDGCHRWKPEEFGKDDLRFGWTWDHCWQDAVALLGSEDAVQKYVEGTHDKEEEAESHHDGPTDLFGSAIPTDLFGNEMRNRPGKRKN